MKKLRLLGLLAIGAGALVLCTHVAISQTKKQKVEVIVGAPPAPSMSKMSFSCWPSNLRSSGGVAYMSWSSEGATSATITSNTGRPAPGAVAPTGSTHFASGLSWGGEDVTYTFRACNGDACSQKSCSIGMHCFVKGTDILMEDGSYKNIEDVKVGDRVMSYDTELGRYVGAAVVRTTKNDAGKYYNVNDTMKITPGHVLNVSGDWKLSDEMKVGDFLTNANGDRVAIDSIEEVNEPAEVFNLITEEPNNFFAEDFLVHNEDALPAHKDKGLYPGMKITLADGRQVDVEKVKAGDRILAFDAKSKRYAISTVKQTASQTVAKTLIINKRLRVAPKQQFYKVPPGGEPAKKLRK
ncbi:MAG TPA: hypothetical protein DCM05_00925 [Elusimicrobia bacterium]|nr:hypothetical protein [Elusimicrobiota bacterium]